MATTAQTIATRIRTALGDTVTPYRWGDPMLLDRINQMHVTICGRRPEAGFTSSVTATLPTALTALSENIGLLDEYADAIMHGVCYQLFIEDADMHDKDLAAFHKAAFEAEVGG